MPRRRAQPLAPPPARLRGRLAALAPLLAVLALLAACRPPPPPRPGSDAVFDLRAADFRQPVELDGAWELYPGRLLLPEELPAGRPGDTAERMRPDEPWSRHGLSTGGALPSVGALTLRLRVLLPPRRLSPQGGPLALRAKTYARAMRVFVSEVEAPGPGPGPSGNRRVPLLLPLSAGVVSTEPSAIRGNKQTFIAALPPRLQDPAGQGPGGAPVELELVVQLANRAVRDVAGHVHLSIGREQALRAEESAEQQVQLLLIGVSLVIGLYHLAMFATRRSERAPLYFGLFCIALGVRQFMLYGFLEARLLDSGLMPGVIWERQTRIEYLGFFLSVPLFSLYLLSLFPSGFSRRLVHALLALSLLTCALVLVLPLHIAARSVGAFEKLTLCVAGYIVFGMVRVLRRGPAHEKESARLIAAGTLVLIATAVHDILGHNKVIRSSAIEHYGMFAFIFCQAFVLAVNNARARRDAERLAAELDRKNAALSRLDQMKDEFLANTSHELRTPLSGILGLAEALLSSERLPERAREPLRLIVASGKRLASLVSDILDFAKLRHEGLTLQKRPVDARVLVELVLALARPLAQGKRLVLENKLPEQVPYVLADENRLQQILTNLVGNAVKFTSEGSVEVSAEVCSEGGGGALAISVTDTGIGIPASEHQRIFEAFSQVDGSAAREAGGTGLGLTITKKLVELHGGSIRLRSAPGQGSCFTFTLPLADAVGAGAGEAGAQAQSETARSQSSLTMDAIAAASPSQPELERRSQPGADRPGAERPGGAAPARAPFRVLVVDDDAVNRVVLSSQLVGAGYEVREAGSGQAALEQLSAARFDAVVLDVMMPRMSGYQVLTELRKRYPASELPVLLLTAKNQEQDLAEGFRRGTNDYLTKPFSRTELLSRIATHITLAKTNRAYGRFVPHEFIQLLGKQNVVYVDIGDHVHLPRMTILFCDVRGFTALAESLDAGGVFGVLGRLLSRVSPILRQHRGFVDKFIGDAVMGLFPDAAQDAALAAVEIQQAVQRFAATAPELRGLSVGIGVHTGSTMLGTIGDADRMEATVLSDAVNVAARLEGLTRMFGVGILISDEALQQIREPEALSPRALGGVRVKGKRQSIRVHELLAGEPGAVRQHKEGSRAEFARALGQFQRGEIAAARAGFEAILAAAVAAGSDDGPARLYVAQCERWARGGLPLDWDGGLDFFVK